MTDPLRPDTNIDPDIDPDDTPSNPSTAPALGDVITTRFSRRHMIRGTLGTAAIAAMTGNSLLGVLGSPAQAGENDFSFKEIEHGVDETHHVAAGYDADILIRWGDPVLPGAPDFDPGNQTPDGQSRQFGSNNDYVGFIPLPHGSQSATRGLLCVNHEFTSSRVMFPRGFNDNTRRFEIEMAAHGGSIIEIARGPDNRWTVDGASKYARRISATTPMRLSGPAAGDARMKTSADPSGMKVLGTVNNCAGGITPWGTYLMAEENFNNYFIGSLKGHPEQRNYKRYGLPRGRYAWGTIDRRWNIDKEPKEPNRFGWIVEVDALDPASEPIKRTALGRFKHEGAEAIVNRDGRVVIYSGDDQRFDYLYRFVSRDRVDPENRRANLSLLDTGTLSVAKFEADGSLTWLDLVWGQGPLTPNNGFSSQADVLIETRRAADFLEATPLDRPEDVQPNSATGKVYLILTNNSKRKADNTDGINRREKNIWGQIVELSPPDGDHAARSFAWDILIQCGDPKRPETRAIWHPDTSANGWFSCPDNAAVDAEGRLWVATDQGRNWSRTSGTADGLWAVATSGPGRGTGRMFFRVPVGAELCGPCFTPDGETLFLAVQHPSTDGAKQYKKFGRRSTFEDPATRWPDFKDDMPPRPSIVVITKKGGGRIGS